MNRKRYTLADYNKNEATEDEIQFFIVYEGEIKEPKYFETFNNEFSTGRRACIFHILEKDTNILGSQPKKLVERVKEFKKNTPNNLFISDYDKIRFVLDVDTHPTEQYPELKKYCESLIDAELFISNYCFEVWLWFHLDEQENIKSKTSKEMKKELGKKHTQSKIKNYPKGYLTIECISKAIERAEKADLNKNHYFPAEKSTKVYLLMQELLKYYLLNNSVKDAEIL
ncbi:RloB family protein [Flavobacterium sp. GSP14]|uniref:RloB family protein n=1 Tax=Flavobacterium sp. GSP14 TaxID=3401734 RepID=UPI003AAE3B78